MTTYVHVLSVSLKLNPRPSMLPVVSEPVTDEWMFRVATGSLHNYFLLTKKRSCIAFNKVNVRTQPKGKALRGEGGGTYWERHETHLSNSTSYVTKCIEFSSNIKGSRHESDTNNNTMHQTEAYVWRTTLIEQWKHAGNDSTYIYFQVRYRIVLLPKRRMKKTMYTPLDKFDPWGR